jgi:hypothetical protein
MATTASKSRTIKLRYTKLTLELATYDGRPEIYVHKGDAMASLRCAQGEGELARPNGQTIRLSEDEMNVLGGPEVVEIETRHGL